MKMVEEAAHISSLITDGPVHGNGNPNDEQQYRVVGWALLVGLIVAFGVLFLLNNDNVGVSSARAQENTTGIEAALFPSMLPSRLVMAYMPVRDTLYTTDTAYLEVNLSKQNVTVHFRGGNSRTFRISSGNKYVRDGMETPDGLYTVQNKVPLAISKQFNDAKLFNWIGVYGGIGFHGLEGNGYYSTLGQRPSSHGCMRMAREEILEMYDLVRPGMLILIYKNTPARVVAFCHQADTVGAILIDSVRARERNIGKERMIALMNGEVWTARHPNLVHLKGQRTDWRIEIGNAGNIPRQHVPRFGYIPNGLLATHALDVPDNVATRYAEPAVTKLVPIAETVKGAGDYFSDEE